MSTVKVKIEEYVGKVEKLIDEIKSDLPKVIAGQPAGSKRFRVNTSELSKITKEARKLSIQHQKETRAEINAAKLADKSAKAKKA